MEYTVLLQQILILFAIAACGFIAFKRGMMTEAANKAVSKIVLHITLPAMILASVADVPGDFTAADILFLIALSFLSYAILGIVAFLTPRLIRGEKRTTAFMSSSPCSAMWDLWGFRCLRRFSAVRRFFSPPFSTCP